MFREEEVGQVLARWGIWFLAATGIVTLVCALWHADPMPFLYWLAVLVLACAVPLVVLTAVVTVRTRKSTCIDHHPGTKRAMLAGIDPLSASRAIQANSTASATAIRSNSSP